MLPSVLLLLAPLAACVRLGAIARRAPHPLASLATAVATPVAAAGLDPDAAFEAAVRHCEDCVRAPADTPLSAEVPRLLRAAFDADFERLLARGGRAVTNVTCMQPAEAFEGSQQLFDDELLAVPLREGRVCRGGVCCDACSRVAFDSLVTPAEADAFLEELQYAIVPPLHQFSARRAVHLFCSHVRLCCAPTRRACIWPQACKRAPSAKCLHDADMCHVTTLCHLTPLWPQACKSAPSATCVRH